MSLAETQRRIWQLVTAPEGVEKALREEAAEASPALESLIRGDERAGAAVRLDVYANAYFYRVHGALESDYPALAAALGEEGFNDVVTSYLLVYPPGHPSLRYAGARLAKFLASHDVAAGIRSRAPWAADLALFEWAMIDTFDAAPSAALTRESVASRDPEAFGGLELTLRPGAQLVELALPVSAMRTAHDTAESIAPPQPDAAAETVLIWRPVERVRYRTLDANEAHALTTLVAGTRFGELCDHLATIHEEAETPAIAAGLLERWLADEILGEPRAAR